MRRAARTDSDHRLLFDLAKRLGAGVIETYMVGGGCPDGFVWAPNPGRWFAVEIKADDGELTPDQREVHALVPIEIWRTHRDVMATLGFWRAK